MVCIKRDGHQHDFQKDALKLKIENNYIYAENTTLGTPNKD
jgi:dipeptidase D